VLDETLEHAAGCIRLGFGIELTESFLHPIGDRHVGVRVAQLEQ
jgi:hypothetical protein